MVRQVLVQLPDPLGSTRLLQQCHLTFRALQHVDKSFTNTVVAIPPSEPRVTLQEIPVDLVLSIEYLDYAREAHVRPGIDTLPASRRALHSISCLLSNMPVIVNPPVGQATAVSFCEDLSICIRGLRNEVRLSPANRAAVVCCGRFPALQSAH